MKTIAIDAFGGDHAPGQIVEGALLALKEYNDLKVLLAGREEELRSELAKHTYDKERLEILPAQEVITCEEAPVMAVRRKRDSSLVVACNAVAQGQAQAIVSAGSTGAFLAAGTFIVKRIGKVKRPGLAPLLPTLGNNPVLLIDCGANVDCTPGNLVQFALMGSTYMKNVLGVENPRIGLLNNGAEEEKGCALTKEVYGRLKELPEVCFAGNCEGRDILSGDFDVVVADGFTGNIALKSMEGTAELIMSILKKELYATTRTKLGALLAKPALKSVKKTMDYNEVGGALLLGVKGCMVKAHGSSKAYAFFNAIGQAYRMIEGKVVETIEEHMQNASQEEQD